MTRPRNQPVVGGGTGGVRCTCPSVGGAMVLSWLATSGGIVSPIGPVHGGGGAGLGVGLGGGG